MGRPSKSAKVLSDCSQTKAEINKRILTEEKLRGNSIDIQPPDRLNANQKKIFRFIVSHLKDADILGTIDMYILESGAIAIDRLQTIEKMINKDFSNIYSKELMAAKSKYSTDFHKAVNDLSLSPQSRAKFGIISANKKEEDTDPLLKVLDGRIG